MLEEELLDDLQSAAATAHVPSEHLTGQLQFPKESFIKLFGQFFLQKPF